jgi:hypothetical protein
MDGCEALRAIAEGASKNHTDAASLRMSGDRREQQVHCAIAVLVVRSFDEIDLASLRQRQVRRWLADIANAKPELLIFLGDHDGSAERRARTRCRWLI